MSGTAPCQVMEPFQAGIVAPMHILNDQHDRLFGAQSGKPACQCLKEATFLLFWFKPGKWRQWIRIGQSMNQIRNELSELEHKRSQLRSNLSFGLTGKMRS